MTERTTNSEAAASLVDIELGASAMYDAQPRVQPDPPGSGFSPGELSVAAGRLTRALAVIQNVPNVSDIYQYRQAAPDLATSGQPREEELSAIAAAGYEVVINLALHDDPRYSLPDEAASVRALGLEYVHIPVSFDAPTRQDLLRFFEAMDARNGKRIWLHCAANLRVTAFLGLYRRLGGRWPKDRAFELMNDVWEPNPVWASFIDDQLAAAHDG